MSRSSSDPAFYKARPSSEPGHLGLNGINALMARFWRGRLRPRVGLPRIPRVSVVIPCYNYGRYLLQCVESVTHNQPNIDVEVIIVDDKSTDDSLTIARAIERCDGRVRVLANDQNQGHIATYNKGLDAATGEFVLLLSADDLLTPGSLTRAAELLVAEPSVGLVYGNAIPLFEHLPVSRVVGTSWIVWTGKEWLRHRCLSGYNVVASPEVVMRTVVLRSFGGYRQDLPHAGDFEMWLRTSAVSDIGFLMGVDQAYRRHHGHNMNRIRFGSGTPAGQLTDLLQRWQCFEAVFAGAGRGLSDGAQLLRIARRTIARQSLEHINYAYARGFRDFPIADFEDLAIRLDEQVAITPTGKALARRKRFGMISMPLHPLWGASAVRWRVTHLLRRWRRRKFGI